jgi:hypothetical protein
VPRHYDPTIGRFISVDPVLNSGDPQLMSGYTYAGDNPTTSSDPSGLCSVDKCGYATVNNGTLSLYGPIDPSNSGAGWVSPTDTGAGAFSGGHWPKREPIKGVLLGALNQSARGQSLTAAQLSYMEKSLHYAGSDNFSIGDALTWLSSKTPTQDGAWDFYCQGLEGKQGSSCAANPFDGNGNICLIQNPERYS